MKNKMDRHALFSESDIKQTYRKVHDLLITGHIIRSCSTNKNDVRDVALHDLDLSRVKRVLELGCGYGFFIEKLKGALCRNAVIQGLDLVENNREPYLHSVASIGYCGEFIEGSADCICKMESSGFDLIIACYSLYFFPHLISEIGRLLKPGGVFISITHSSFSLQEIMVLISQCLKKMGLPEYEDIRLNKLFRAFSMENGHKLLSPFFRKIEKIDFRNKMLFSVENIDDCIFFLAKKRFLIYREILDACPKKVDEFEFCLFRAVNDFIRENGEILLNKDDAIFRCYI